LLKEKGKGVAKCRGTFRAEHVRANLTARVYLARSAPRAN